MLKFFNLQPEVFAVDINDFSVKVAKLKKKRDGFCLASFGEAEIAQGIVKEGTIQDEAILAKIIKSAYVSVSGEKIKTKHVIVSLPEEKSFSQTIQMPKMTEQELRSAVFFEMENYIPLPVDEVYWDFQVIGSSSNNAGQCDVLVNVMSKSVVDSYVSCLTRAGFIPCAMETESQSIIRALTKKGEANKTPCLFIDFGQNSANFIVFSDNSIRFTCSIPISSQHLTQAISKEMGVGLKTAEELKIRYGLTGGVGIANLSTDNIKKARAVKSAITPIVRELVNQVEKYINFYHSHVSESYFPKDGKIEKIVLSGGGSSLKKIAEFVFDESSIKTEVGNPLANIAQKVRSIKFIPLQKTLSFTTAFGLAIRGANSDNFEF